MSREIRRSRTGFGSKGNAKHAANIAQRKEDRNIRVGLFKYLRERYEKKKGLAPSRRQLRAELAAQRRDDRKKRKRNRT